MAHQAQFCLSEKYPDIEKLKVEEERNAEEVDGGGQSDGESVAAGESEASVMESFGQYKPKIEQLLDTIGLANFSIDVIQHGYNFMNCVYALTSSDGIEQYILRVAINGCMRDSDGRHETLENDIVLLGYLEDKLPVPRIKAYSLTADNVLGAAYTVQTRILGRSLDTMWATLDYADKYAIVDEFLDLLVRLESVQFAIAGTFAISAPLPAQANDFSTTEDPICSPFDVQATAPSSDPQPNTKPVEPNLKSLLTSNLEKWIQEEIDRDQHELSCAIGPRFKKLLAMLQDMQDEGGFKDDPFPIVLHHWDLEPRNLMVSKASGTWKVCGVIDWDDAVTLPTPLARIPPRWIWYFADEEPDLEDGWLSDDQYKDPELSDENKALKAYFDTKVETVLPGYNEDAYGRGRWLRRIWHFAKEGAYRQWQWPFLDQLPIDWAARPKTEVKASIELE
ncbi:MAG: hypothetical protein Q9201_004269 [Fulgogasparrea decipioides]